MSIRSLLTHTAGTADSTADAFPQYLELLLTDLSRVFAPTEVVELMAALTPHAVPDASYRYSNTDYQILGVIAEHVSARPFATLIQDLAQRLDLRHTRYDVSLPADLKHAWFDIESVGTAGATPQRDQDANDFPNEALITTAYAAGGMTSSLADLLAWGDALYLGDALSASMREQLLASPSIEDPDTGRGHGFGVAGYGTLAADGSWSAYGHEGNVVGSSAFVASFPNSRTTVAIHANIQEVSTEALIDLAFDLERITT
jgi:D-alanyl-D-alanine carboxypeptidase